MIDIQDVVYLVERSRSRSNRTLIVDFKIVKADRTIESIGSDVATLYDLPYSQERQGIVFTLPQTAEAVVRRLATEAGHTLEIEWL